MRYFVAFVFLFAIGPVPTALYATSSSAPAELVTGLIVKFDEEALAKQPSMASTAGRAAALSAASGARIGDARSRMTFARTLAVNAELYRFAQPLPIDEARAIAANVASQKTVVYAVLNRRMTNQAVPVDNEYPVQWGFRLNATEQGANFEAAWDVTKGNATQTLGVVDSGISRTHPDLASKLRVSPDFPNGGYDFFQLASASPPDTRDNDPEQTTSACGHGAHVAGTIAADTKFSSSGGLEGVAGGVPNAKVLMGRALDFSGEEADVVDAMLWLGGFEVAGVPANPNPVSVINMSLGGSGACGPAYAEAVDRLASRGIVVVAAAGNSGSDAANFAPSNCRGVVSVAASEIDGSLASFSNRGRRVTLTAPGVNIFSSGGSTGENCYKSGTSMAAPHVTAAVGLAQSVEPSLSVAQTTLALRAGARPFPAGSNCTAELCGAGLLDARRTLDRVGASAPTTIGWANNTARVRENDGQVTLSLARIGSSSGAVNVLVLPVSGSATSGVDFGAPVPAQVSWAAGDSADKTVSVPIISRSGEQGVREFSLALASSSASVQLVSPTAVPVQITEVDCNAVTDIAIGETKTGDLGVAGNTYCRGGIRGPEYDTVRYRVTVPAGTRLTIILNGTSPQPAVLDTYVYLLDSNLRPVIENDDVLAGVVRNSLVDQFLVAQAGTYYIDVTTWSSTEANIGTYSLQVVNCGPYTAAATCSLDVDGDGYFDRTDAVIALRRMLGFSGEPLTAGLSFRACATRIDGASVASFVDAQMANNVSAGGRAFDLDGDGEVRAGSDGLALLRFVQGRPDSSIESQSLNPSAPRNTASSVRQYLSQRCNLN